MQITNEAKSEFMKMLQESGEKNAGIRIDISGSSCCSSSFNLEVAEKGKKDDETIEKDGIKIFISSVAKAKLGDSIIDFSDDSFNIRDMKSSSCCG